MTTRTNIVLLRSSREVVVFSRRSVIKMWSLVTLLFSYKIPKWAVKFLGYLSDVARSPVNVKNVNDV